MNIEHEKDNKDNILLTFCIPTYNRCERLLILINEILKYKGNDIEVVVSDNASTDDTIEQLKAINDQRLIIKQNKSNLDASMNFFRALENGHGKYLFHLNDRDIINMEYLERFLSILNELPEFSAGIVRPLKGNERTDRYDFEIFKQGKKALLKFAYMDFHPTGILFNSKEFKKIQHRKKFFDGSSYTKLHPYSPLLTELAVNGNCILFHIPIWNYAEQKFIKENKSRYTSKKGDANIYFTPASRFQHLILYTKHINDLKVSNEIKQELVKSIYDRLLYDALYVYRDCMADRIEANHYKMKIRKISKLEALSICVSFCAKFIVFLLKNNFEFHIMKQDIKFVRSAFEFIKKY